MTKLHTESRYEQDMMKLKDAILRMGDTVERMIECAMRALHHLSRTSTNDLAAFEEKTNMLEMAIDAMCVEIIARYQPAASDLRFIIAGLKISKDLERMGDLALNIAEKLGYLTDPAPPCSYDDLMRMAERSTEMVRDTLKAFIQKDAALAHEVCMRDDEIDMLNSHIRDELVFHMQEKSPAIAQDTTLILVTHNLERIADHATNIAEETVFFVEGQDMRHGGAHS